MDDPIEVGEDALAMENYEMDVRPEPSSPIEPEQTTVPDEKPQFSYTREEIMTIREDEKYDIEEIGDLNHGPYNYIILEKPRGASSDLASLYPPPIIYNQIVPPHGVDPFALLKLCEGAKRKMDGDVYDRFKQLLICYNQCDQKQLNMRTRNIFHNSGISECSLCQATIPAIANMVVHMCNVKHVAKAPQPRSPRKKPPTRIRIEEDASIVNCQQISPPPLIDPLALLRSCVGAKIKLRGDVFRRFKQLLTRYQQCNKKRLRHKTKDMFPINPPLSCLLCDATIVCANSLIMHICGFNHIAQMKGAVCAGAFEFWLEAINDETTNTKELPAPPDGYSREDIIRIRDLEVQTEGIYSAFQMKQMRYLPAYSWQMDGVAEKDSLAVMDNWFPDRRRKRNKVAPSEYWLWHNVNAQQSFAVYFGFFPFYLPYLDEAAFISASRPDSIVPVYLTSQLYQEHLNLREKYEGAEECPYRAEEEKIKRKELIAAHQSVMRFPLTNEQSIVHYEDSEGKVQECNLNEAQIWFHQGYFSSQMKFAVAPKDVEVQKKASMVFAFKGLMVRNGKAMPFFFSDELYSDTTEDTEEIEEMREELLELGERRKRASEQLQLLQSRHSSLQEIVQRMAKSFPVLANRSAQANATVIIAAKVEASEPSQLVAKPGVDPLAVLKSIPKESTVRKICEEAEILYRFDQLLRRFDQCDKKELVLRSTSIINKKRPASCRLCDLKMESTSTFIEHLTCKKHAYKLTAVNADALDFWFDAVGEVSKSRKPEISPLAILSACSSPANPHPDLHQAASAMQHNLKNCDRKALEGEPTLRALFNTRISCSVCVRQVFIDKPANLIAHFATAGHIAAAIKHGGMAKEVVNYWMRALDRAMEGDINR